MMSLLLVVLAGVVFEAAVCLVWVLKGLNVAGLAGHVHDPMARPVVALFLGGFRAVAPVLAADCVIAAAVGFDVRSHDLAERTLEADVFLCSHLSSHTFR